MALRLALILAALSLALPAGAGAGTFGSDLNRAPDSTLDCTVVPNVMFNFNIPTGANTCTAWTTGLMGDTSEGHIVPAGGGTLTALRVRVGPTTGPMQFLVLRSIRQGSSLANPACCYPVGHTDVFTPAPDSVTTVPVNIPVRNGPHPRTGIMEYDHIAISVLAPGVPIPAALVGTPGDYSSAPGGGVSYPAMVAGAENLTGYGGLSGYQVLINGDIGPGSTGGGRTTTPPPGDAIRLARERLKARGARVAIPLTCAAPAGCAGTLTLQDRPNIAGVAIAKRARTYASAKLRLRPGKNTVKVKLTRAARKAIARKGSLKAWANLKAGSVKTTTEVRITR